MPQKTQEETGRVKKIGWPVHLTVYTTPWDRCPKHTLLDLHFSFLIFNPEEPNTPTPALATLRQCSASAVFSHLGNEILTTCHLRLIKAQMEVTCFQEKINYSLISWAYLKQLQGTGSTPPAAPAQTMQPHRGLKQALLSKSSPLRSRTAWSLFSLLTNLYFFFRFVPWQYSHKPLLGTIFSLSSCPKPGTSLCTIVSPAQLGLVW